MPKDTIHVIAQSIGISNLQDDVAAALAPDVEYRMREIMQEAIKCMRHSKRSILTTDDVDSALRLRNVEPLYGFASGDPLRFRRPVGHSDLFYVEDRDLEFKEIIDAPLPRAPLDTSVVAHWLAVEGVQPAIPENAPIENLAVPPETKRGDAHGGGPRKEDDGAIEVKIPVKHVLSRELQLYFEKITELIVAGSDTLLLRDAFLSVATDSGLHPLVPYFTQFVADEVTRGLEDFPLLFSLMRLVQSLLLNPHIHIEPYLHQLMPSVITCLVAKRLGGRAVENHWELRDFTASLVAFICKRFGHTYQNLQPRVTRTLLHAFLDPKRALTQHYGAIRGLSALGSRVVRLLVLPNLELYLHLLAPELSPETQQNEMKRYEAWRVYGALLNASGACVYEKVKAHPYSLPTVSTSTLPKIVADTGLPSKQLESPMQISPSRKRSAGTDLGQPSQKKLHVESGLLAGDATGSVTEGRNFDGGEGSSQAEDVDGGKSRGVESGSMDDGGRRLGVEANRSNERKSFSLAEAWKEDVDFGSLLLSLVDLFGDSMLPFIPTEEMSLFL